MSQVISSQVLANGLRTEFANTYQVVRQRQSDSRLGLLMDLSLGATNRRHEFAYFEAAPHMEYWRRGDAIPADSFGSVQFTVPVYNWGRKISWHRDDRDDDQTQSLMEQARGAGESAALLPERLFFDAMQGTTNTLPAVPLAPDGSAMYATTAGGADRFGVSGGNLLTGSGVASAAAIRSDYYDAIEQFKLMQDGKGQPLHSDETVDGGVIIVHGAANTQAFEEAFLQRRTGEVLGTDAGVTPTNIVQDASRDVTLWGTQRITGDDFYIFLRRPPKQATFLLTRQDVREAQALVDDNNSDRVRETGEESVQWDGRWGAGIALPYATVKVNN